MTGERVLARLRWFNERTCSALERLCAVNVAGMLIVVVLAVFARKTGFVLSWTDKIFAILLPVLAFGIAPVAYRRSVNVALNSLRDRLPAALQTPYTLLLNVVLLFLLLSALDLSMRKAGFNPAALSAVLSWVIGVDLAEIRPSRARILIPILNLPWRYVYMTIPVCIALMVLVNIEYLLGCVLRLAGRDVKAVPPHEDEAMESAD